MLMSQSNRSCVVKLSAMHGAACVDDPIQPISVCVIFFSIYCFAQSELHILFNIISSSLAWFVKKILVLYCINLDKFNML